MLGAEHATAQSRLTSSGSAHGAVHPLRGGVLPPPFASQGAGKLLGPVLAGTFRLCVVAAGGIWLTQNNASAFDMFALIAAGMVGYGLLTALAVYKVSWAR